MNATFDVSLQNAEVVKRASAEILKYRWQIRSLRTQASIIARFEWGGELGREASQYTLAGTAAVVARIELTQHLQGCIRDAVGALASLGITVKPAPEDLG